ncbi:class I SAM-dependent methyltransferase [Nonlabens ponticola]|uniref:Class I SAM-dependent methyltransferase n=1 Tax=Nonlabens ponticola TaxID=2496866 RepID=A0A3S9MZ51_9FLAO|nr:class I SAM-dependent methyltransferase [Nonlabens ponticola]AZQ44372.1 class I SAM-dependent methyltransferase [Nonlabens ponticola]
MIYSSSKRSTLPEMMDDPSISQEQLRHAVNDVNKVNTYLGGYKFTLNAVKKALQNNPKDSYTIIDLGCSDGAMLRYLSDHLAHDNIDYIGVDLSTKSISNAREKCKNYSRISFRESDILKTPPEQLNCDIMLCTLTLHHFNEEQIPKFLNKFQEITSTRIIINDLHRNILAFYFFKFFSPIFIKHRISRHDGLISIASGFKRSDFKRYADKCSITNDRLTWKWSFRYIWEIPINER